MVKNTLSNCVIVCMDKNNEITASRYVTKIYLVK